MSGIAVCAVTNSSIARTNEIVLVPLGQKIRLDPHRLRRARARVACMQVQA